MSTPRVSEEKARSWLSLHGQARQSAVIAATDALLCEYSALSKDDVLPDLELIAKTLDIRIRYVSSLAGDAAIYPAEDGFLILARQDQEPSRLRTSIAHEIVHSLFYSRDHPIPRRKVPPTPVEENFCFDVSRRILSPIWVLDKLGINQSLDPVEIYHRLRRDLKLSRQVAARIMLQDYQLAAGVAASWRNTKEGWKLQQGEVYASPRITPGERRRMRSMVKDWLTARTKPPIGHTIIASNPGSGGSAFVMMIRDESSPGNVSMETLSRE